MGAIGGGIAGHGAADAGVWIECGTGGCQKMLRHAGYQLHDLCAAANDATTERGRHVRLLLTHVMADVAVAARAAKKHKTMHLTAHPNAWARYV